MEIWLYALHPSAHKIISRTIELVINAISKYDVPENLTQYLKMPTKESTQELMNAFHVVVAKEVWEWSKPHI